VIGTPTLQLLLRSLDVMPFWRDKLTAIAYSPYTRVDVRRMHKLGILDLDGVYAAYRDIGYDHEKATGLLQFTVAYNKTESSADTEDTRELSKSDILGLFNDGVVDSDSSRLLLAEIGYSQAEAELLIERESLQDMLQERKDDIALIVDNAKAGALTWVQAQDSLARLDLTSKELAKASLQIQRSQETLDKLPTKSELKTWAEFGLITPLAYGTALEGLGYAPRWVRLYMAGNYAGSSPQTHQIVITALRELGHPDSEIDTIRSWFKSGGAGSKVEIEPEEDSIE